ncbi:MAG: hypothetical protein H7333_02320 [Bdellovibrionales bacterium]|nr:hypothetical protein [Oligoflexia bacterium]
MMFKFGLLALVLTFACVLSLPNNEQSTPLNLGSISTLKKSKPDLADLKKPVSDGIEFDNVRPEARTQQQEFTRLRKKVLKTPTESEEYSKILSNERLMTDSLEKLNTRLTSFSKENEFDRMKAIDFLTEAARWKKNPIRENILSETSKFLTRPMPKMRANSDLQKSLIGDRVEMFLLLAVQGSERARAVLDEMNGTPEKAYYQFSTAFYLRKNI